LLTLLQRERPEAIVHFAAETHVDRSIHQSALPFIETNVKGTQNLIDAARMINLKRFIHISTDEVYGQIKIGQFTEQSPIQPNNPYSATKAAADHLIMAATRTHGFPAIIARPSNNYGPWQYPEKLIPVIIIKALNNKPVPVYGQGQHVREWLHVSDCASAILFILEHGKTGEIYNIGSRTEKQNIDTVKKILKLLGKPESLIQFVKDRPGHDIRYSLNWDKLSDLGWRPKIGFEKGMALTVDWSQAHIKWLRSKTQFLEKYWKMVYKKA